MWTRAELKEKGRISFKRNYWKSVLVALFVSLVAGGMSGGTYTGNSFNSFPQRSVTTEKNEDEAKDLDAQEKELEKSIEAAIGSDERSEELANGIIGMVKDAEDASDEMTPAAIATVVTVTVIIFIIVFAIAMVIAFAFSALLLNPIDMGCKRFFLRNLEEEAKVSENVLYGFDNSYKNVAKTLFFRDLYTFLWSLLCVIPGIVKSYEYRMIPYLLAENPDLTMEDAFAQSKAMMDGQKWRAFVLDLSFIGWDLLSICTCGILSTFFVEPYKNATKAALYDTLRVKEEEIPQIAQEAYTDEL